MNDFFNTSQRPPYIEMIRTEVRDTHERMHKAGQPMDQIGQAATKLFTIRTGQHWVQDMKNVAAPRMLMGEFWREGELCLLFADTNMGKSVLAVQAGNAIGWGQPTGGPFAMQVHDAAVLYLDFELTAKQFELRYVDAHNRSLFSKRFYRAEFKPPLYMPAEYKNMDEYLNAAITYSLKQTGAKVLIIDNLTSLHYDTGHAGGALPLMQRLRKLKADYKLSILALAHTPKRKPQQPLTRNDLQGSKLLLNFADSALAIGESLTMPGHRYIKQIKQRSSAEVYGADNVCVCKLEHTGGCLRYEPVDYTPESEHLYRRRNANHEELTAQAAALHAAQLSQRQIAARLNISLGMVNKLLHK